MLTATQPDAFSCRNWDARTTLRRLAVLATLALGGCAETLAYSPVPEAAIGKAELAGFTSIRVWGDAKTSDIAAITDFKDVAPIASPRIDGRGVAQAGPSYLASSRASARARSPHRLHSLDLATTSG
jgi:hypothetical protein